MPIRGDESIPGEDGEIRINIAGNILSIKWAGLAGSGNTDPLRAGALEAAIQALLDREPFGSAPRLNQLASDDPNRTMDPAQPYAFWLNGNPARIQFRTLLVKNVKWNPDTVRFHYGISALKPSQR